MRYLLIALIALAVLVPSVANADRIIGQASVIDGDTIEIHDQRIRLHGIDAPESDQLCYANDEITRCGQKAATSLDAKIADQVVTCEPTDRDRYGRVVAVCSAGGEDLNAWMVAVGMALAYRQYSNDYVVHEEVASANKRGIWEGEFAAPWEWRQNRRIAQAKEQETDRSQCTIKGNISTRTGERIYHVPGGQYYSRTKINPSKGERFFCSEAEARAAGWRKSKR